MGNTYISINTRKIFKIFNKILLILWHLMIFKELSCFFIINLLKKHEIFEMNMNKKKVWGKGMG